MSTQSNCAHSLLRFSSVSSDDSLPLGCEHKEYYWIKRYRALKRSISDDPTDPHRPADLTDADAHRFKRLPCTRFYLDRDYPFLPDLRGMLCPDAPEDDPNKRLAMLRTQESLVISSVSSRWFHLEIARPLQLLAGVTNEGKRLQPQCLEEMKVVQLDLQRGDRVKLLVTPSLGYGRAPLKRIVEGTDEERTLQSASQEPSQAASRSEARAPAFRLKGDLTVFVNDKTSPDWQIEHELEHDDECPVYGLVVWAGTLSDVKVMEH